MTHSDNRDSTVAIVGAARTPCGCFNGVLKEKSATDLGAIAIKGAVKSANFSASAIEEVIMGCVLPAGLGQAPARHAAIVAGLPLSAGCTTINKVCGSAMKATMLAHDLIKVGSNRIMIAGGMESMSNAPKMVAPNTSLPIESKELLKQHLFYDGLQDAETGKLMGVFAQEVADSEGYTRAQLDEYAALSLQRAQHAISSGLFNAEIVPVTVTTPSGTPLVVKDDEQPGKASLEKIPLLKPAFSSDGTITAANSSSISDGASALLLMDAVSVEHQGLNPLARIIGHASYAQHPSLFSTAPVFAIEKLLHKIGWDKASVDLWEINEAFALVALLAIDKLKLDINRVNVHGGACALGHPIGSSGCRIIVSLIYALKQQGKKRGVASLCIGGGEATAIAIEV